MFWKYAANLQENTHAGVRALCNFIEIKLRHGCSPVHLLHIFKTSFPENTSELLLLELYAYCFDETSSLFICLFILPAVIHALVFPPNISLGKLRSIPPEICSSFTGEHPCWSVISIKLLFNFIEITLQYGCSPVNLLHIVRTPFIRTPLES